MLLTLSDETVVTFKEFVSHKADKLMFEAMAGVESSPLKNEDEKKKDRALAYLSAIEQAIPLLVASVVRNGAPIPPAQPWLDELPREDYAKLQDAAMALYNQSASDKEEGKKNG